MSAYNLLYSLPSTRSVYVTRQSDTDSPYKKLILTICGIANLVLCLKTLANVSITDHNALYSCVAIAVLFSKHLLAAKVAVVINQTQLQVGPEYTPRILSRPAKFYTHMRNLSLLSMFTQAIQTSHPLLKITGAIHQLALTSAMRIPITFEIQTTLRHANTVIVLKQNFELYVNINIFPLRKCSACAHRILVGQMEASYSPDLQSYHLSCMLTHATRRWVQLTRSVSTNELKVHYQNAHYFLEVDRLPDLSHLEHNSSLASVESAHLIRRLAGQPNRSIGLHLAVRVEATTHQPTERREHVRKEAIQDLPVATIVENITQSASP